MRIVGGKDYYDGAVPFDADNSRTFARIKHKTLPVKFPFQTSVSLSSYIARPENDGFKDILVIFAGMMYPGIKKSNSFGQNKVYWFYEDFIKDTKDNNVRIHRSSIFRNPYITFKECWEPKPLSGELLEYVMNNNILTAVIKQEWNDVVWNVNCDGLGNIGFASVIPPWEAYQELEMFLGTILVNDQDNMVKISNNSMIKKHGFDQLSFRDQKHRGKPRANK